MAMYIVSELSAAPSLAMLLLLAMRSSSLCSRSLLLLLLFLQVTWGLESARKNVLLLVADDFRPNLGLYDEANSSRPRDLKDEATWF